MHEYTPPEDAKSTRDDLVQQAIEQLFAVVRSIHKGVSPHDLLLSPPQAKLAFAISRHGEEGISVKELAEKAGVTPGAITQLVDVLIAKDVVRRQEDPGDRRIVRLKITPAAERHLHKFREEFIASASQAFSVLSTDELAQLNAILARVYPYAGDGGKRHSFFG